MTDLQHEADTLALRAKVGAEAAYHVHGYVTDEKVDKGRVADVLVGPISEAIAETGKEREKVSITRDQLMAIAFPEVPGRDAWGEEDDPELAEAIYDLLDMDVWRVVDPSPTGQVQVRLNGEDSLVLVRRNGTRKGRAADVYVTRNVQCLMEDVITPKNRDQVKRATLAANLTALLMERVPEHAGKFEGALTRGLNDAKTAAKAITAEKMAMIGTGNGDDEQ